MSGSAARVTITEQQQSMLNEFANARSAEVSLAQRSRIILLAFKKYTNEQISFEVESGSGWTLEKALANRLGKVDSGGVRWETS